MRGFLYPSVVSGRKSLGLVSERHESSPIGRIEVWKDSTGNLRKETEDLRAFYREEPKQHLTHRGLRKIYLSRSRNLRLVLCRFSHDPGSGLAEVLAGLALFGRLRWAGVCSHFQLIGLALCFVGFCTFRPHNPVFEGGIFKRSAQYPDLVWASQFGQERPD
jgi:hypothetical protein